MTKNNESLILGRAIGQYYEEYPFKPTHSDFKKWLKSLDVQNHVPYKYMSFEKCKRVMLFRIYFYNSRKVSLQDYLKNVLDANVYQFYIEKKGNAKLVW